MYIFIWNKRQYSCDFKGFPDVKMTWYKKVLNIGLRLSRCKQHIVGLSNDDYYFYYLPISLLYCNSAIYQLHASVINSPLNLVSERIHPFVLRSFCACRTYWSAHYHTWGKLIQSFKLVIYFHLNTTLICVNYHMRIYIYRKNALYSVFSLDI